ncbi:hypothetical protein DFH07DRAFT_968310 [Mycena maculata]|uniref:Uncharacterized protein n=1 Tax=Mycena maculata TaxID=230809 RepID=A0AAD7I182_9AGAR|nr:hypothetical protein DFH07DRAFT_968310 [Mycena maculata]
MALRYGLLKDISHGPAVQLSERAQFDTIFLDFDTEEELSLYLRRPDIQNYCRVVIGPLHDIIMLVRDRFRDEAPLPRDTPWVRAQMSDYIRLLGSVAAAIHPKDSAASFKRVPTPSLASLIYMRRLIKHFGFHGDNLPLVTEENEQILDTVSIHARDTLMEMSARHSAEDLGPVHASEIHLPSPLPKVWVEKSIPVLDYPSSPDSVGEEADDEDSS